MFVRYRTEAIFLKKLKRFEADEYLIVYSRDFGKIGVTGKSIRKIKSKLRSSSELFCYSSIEFIRGRYYNILTDSELIKGMTEIKKDLSKMSVAFKMTDLLDSFLAEEEEDSRLWLFIRKSFLFLEELDVDKQNKKEDLQSFYYYFAFKFLEMLGYGLQVESCTVGKGKNVDIFSPREGGFVCRVCAKKIKDPLKVRLTQKDILFIKAIGENNFENFFDLCLEFDSLDEVLKNYIALLPSRLS